MFTASAGRLWKIKMELARRSTQPKIGKSPGKVKAAGVFIGQMTRRAVIGQKHVSASACARYN